MIVVLAIPIIPFLLFGEQMNAYLSQWREHPPATAWIVSTVVALLASDIFLPVPSSLVCTLAGGQLGAMLGTFVTWMGMNLGAIIGFALARKWGPAFAKRFSREDEIERAGAMSQRFGPALLAVSRGVPVLAEATVLWMGIHQLPWRQFWLPVLASNLVLAIVYSCFGELAERHESLPIALAASVAIPVILAAVVKRWLPK